MSLLEQYEIGVVKPYDLTCENRRTQLGIRIRLKIVRDEKKGWGLHAYEDIQRGDFVCEYAGNTNRRFLRRFVLHTSLVICIMYDELPIS
jgi:hypothetical protein